jgi:hypothetical protein
MQLEQFESGLYIITKVKIDNRSSPNHIIFKDDIIYCNIMNEVK